MSNATGLASRSIKKGWELTKANLGKVVTFQIVYFIISMVFSGLQESVAPGSGAFWIIFLASFVVSMITGIGLMKFSLKVYDHDESAGLKDLFAHGKYFMPYLLVSILLGLAIAAIPAILIGIAVVQGFMAGTASSLVIVLAVLAILIAIYLSLVFALAALLVIDKDMSPVEAMKKSKALMSGNSLKVQLFILGILSTLVQLLGLIVLFVGLLVAIPVVIFAYIHFYREVLGEGKTAPATPAPVEPTA